MEKRQKSIEVFIAADGSEHLSEFLALEHERKLGEEKSLTEQQLRNQETVLMHAMAVGRIRARWETHPDERDAFLARIRDEHQSNLQKGVELGWWPSFDERGPHAPPQIFKISELEPHEQTRAHLAHKVGAFKSISDARKNGQNIPLVAGDEFWLKKKSIHIKIEP
jgi:hypothetical protein